MLDPGTPVLFVEQDRLRVGTVVAMTDKDDVTVVFDKDRPTEQTTTIDRASLRAPGEAYLDSRGVLMTPMAFSEALELVHAMATDNQLPDPSPEGLAAVRARQQAALDTIEDLVKNHFERIDDEFMASLIAEDEVDAVLDIAPDDSPEDVLVALRLTYDLAARGLSFDPAWSDVSLADEFDRQSQALDVAYGFIKLHGEAFRTRVRSVPAP